MCLQYKRLKIRTSDDGNNTEYFRFYMQDIQPWSIGAHKGQACLVFFINVVLHCVCMDWLIVHNCNTHVCRYWNACRKCSVWTVRALTQWSCWLQPVCRCGRWNTKPFLETDSWNLRPFKLNWSVFWAAIYWTKSSRPGSLSHFYFSKALVILFFIFIVTGNILFFVAPSPETIRPWQLNIYCEELLDFSLDYFFQLLLKTHPYVYL